MKYNYEKLQSIEEKLNKKFDALYLIQNEIFEELKKLSNGKLLKGDELVGCLGEIYTKLICNGTMVDDEHEHDVETNDNLKISVKTRRGKANGWNTTSLIPKICGGDTPTHLMFVHLNKDYSLAGMWLYPWEKLIENDRFKEKNVRNVFRGYYMQLKTTKDREYRIYPNEK